MSTTMMLLKYDYWTVILWALDAWAINLAWWAKLLQVAWELKVEDWFNQETFMTFISICSHTITGDKSIQLYPQIWAQIKANGGSGSK